MLSRLVRTFCDLVMPSPKPAKKLTPADLQRLQAAEAKRQRKRQRLKNVQAN